MPRRDALGEPAFAGAAWQGTVFKEALEESAAEVGRGG